MVVTFDDLPGSALGGAEQYEPIMRSLRDTLRSRGVHAIGFVNEGKLYEGQRLDTARVALLAQWLAAGLALGNHGFGHLDLHRVPLNAWLADARRGEIVTRRLLAARRDTLRWFRHPYLHTGRSLEVRDSALRDLERRGIRVAPVTVDNADYIFARAYDFARRCGRTADASAVAAAYLAYMDTVIGYYEAQSRLLFGREIPQILLVHANHLNAAYGGALLDAIRARGYTFTTLETALVDPAFRSQDSFTGQSGITWLHRWVLSRDRSLLLAGEPGVPAAVTAVHEASERRAC